MPQSPCRPPRRRRDFNPHEQIEREGHDAAITAEPTRASDDRRPTAGRVQPITIPKTRPGQPSRRWDPLVHVLLDELHVRWRERQINETQWISILQQGEPRPPYQFANFHGRPQVLEERLAKGNCELLRDRDFCCR